MDQKELVLYINSEKRTCALNGHNVSLATAKSVYTDGALTDYTLSVASLDRCDWDWDKLDKYYEEMKRGV